MLHDDAAQQIAAIHGQDAALEDVDAARLWLEARAG